MAVKLIRLVLSAFHTKYERVDILREILDDAMRWANKVEAVAAKAELSVIGFIKSNMANDGR
jgi:hypothetical protein